MEMDRDMAIAHLALLWWEPGYNHNTGQHVLWNPKQRRLMRPIHVIKKLYCSWEDWGNTQDPALTSTPDGWATYSTDFLRLAAARTLEPDIDTNPIFMRSIQ